MTRHRPSISSLADLMTLAIALDRDAGRTDGELASRARRLADAPPSSARTPLDEVGLWLHRECEDDPYLGDLHRRVGGAIDLAGLAAAGVGFILGLGAALGAFYYDGAGRVNVVGVLTVFALLPAVLLVPFLLTALPVRATAWMPGSGALLPLLRALSPGRLVRLAMRWSPPAVREALEVVRGRAGAHRRVYAHVEKWSLLRGSQIAALGYQVAALVAALWLVLFTDLAFGWSTTLSSGDAAADAGTMHRITTWLAAPWAWLWPDAVPSADLVDVSRYYRLADTSVAPELAARLGGWWRFLLMSMLVYGLVPRLVTWSLTHARLRRAVRRAVLVTPGVDAVRRRLHLARVRTTATDTDERSPADEAIVSPTRERDAMPRVVAAVNWSDVPIDAADAAALVGVTTDRVIAAGGARSLEQDRAAVHGLPATTGGASGIAILVKAWEPPVGELFDFIQALRERVGTGSPLVVVPLGLNDGRAAGAPSAAELDVWRRAVTSRGDPWLQVLTPPPAESIS